MDHTISKNRSKRNQSRQNGASDGHAVDELPVSISRWRPAEHHFKRHVNLGEIALSTSGITSGGFSFQLDEVPNFAEFQSLFDLYKIDYVEVTMIPSANLVGVSGTAAPFTATRIATVTDLNSSNAFGSFDDARDFESCEVHFLTRTKKRSVRPMFLTGVEEDGSTIVVGGASRGWLNTTRADIPHYGYRYVAEQVSSGYTASVRCEAIYYMTFKAVK
jgi:hypothetical protein